MKTVMVVEDEKLIRQGIAAMIKRSGVPIEEVLECSNGLQAMEILKERHVDVMFTDIRMPKMNGIELVKAMQELDTPPVAIAVSGYDDFSYAVEMMRQGVREYILKPVEREKLREILEKLDAELAKRAESEKNTRHADEQLLRYLLTDENASEKEPDTIKRRLLDEVGSDFYVIASNKEEPLAERIDRKIVLPELDGMQVYIVCADELKGVAEEGMTEDSYDSYAGISGRKSAAEDLKEAYTEAVNNRRAAFCTELPMSACNASDDIGGMTHINQNLIENAKKLCDRAAVSARVQMLGTDKREAIEKNWSSFFTEVKKGHISAQDFERAIADFFKEYAKTYHIHDETGGGLYAPFSYDRCSGYQSDFMEFIFKTNSALAARNSAGQSDEKIRLAIKYINENFSKDLNMAVVSNEVSMNYSLFSTAFKEYTGTNYIDYVKALRMTEAKRLLSETDLRINEIAAKVGYDNEKHFMKSFKASVGVSPGEYRRNVTG